MSGPFTELPGERAGRRGRSLAIAAFLLLMAGVGAVSIVAKLSGSADGRADDSRWVIASVEEQVLTKTLILRGEVGTDSLLSLYMPSSVEGQGVVTRRPAEVGDEINEGSPIIEISGRPIFVLQGEVPTYRTLKPGMSGDDVSQLQVALRRLGYDLDATGTFDEDTKVVVKEFYAASGYEPVATSEDVGQLLLDAQHEVQTASLAVAAAEKTYADDVLSAERDLKLAQDAYDRIAGSRATKLGAAQASLDGARSALDRATTSSDPGQIASAQAAFDEAKSNYASIDTETNASLEAAADASRAAQQTLDLARSRKASMDEDTDLIQLREARGWSEDRLELLQSTTGPTVPQGEIIFAPVFPVVLLPPAEGNAGSTDDRSSTAELALRAPETIGRLGLGQVVVRSEVSAGEIEFVAEAEIAELLDEASGLQIEASLDTASRPADISATGPARSAELILEPVTPLNVDQVGKNVRVTIVGASTSGPVLAVPLLAIASRSDGSTFVSLVNDGRDADPREVDVQVGVSAGGMVEVMPLDSGSLQQGDSVIVGID